MRRLRRAPAADDGLIAPDDLRVLLAAAKRRVVELETEVAAERRRHIQFVDRHRAMLEQHRHGCMHAQELEDVREQRDAAQAAWGDLYRRNQEFLSLMRQDGDRPTVIIAAIEAGDGQ